MLSKGKFLKKSLSSFINVFKIWTRGFGNVSTKLLNCYFGPSGSPDIAFPFKSLEQGTWIYSKFLVFVTFFIISNHSQKKRKDNLETRAEPVVFYLSLEFQNFLELSLREPAWNINKKVRGTIEHFKINGLFSCFVLNLGRSGENCLIFNWSSSMAAPGILIFRVSTKDDECSTSHKNSIVAVVTRDKVMNSIWKDKLKTKHFELHCS